jgi:hypothetical protein
MFYIGSVTPFLPSKPESRREDNSFQGFPMEGRELGHQLNPIMLVCLSMAIHAGLTQVPLSHWYPHSSRIS